MKGESLRYNRPLPKCLYCDNEVIRPSGVTCGSDECQLQRKVELKKLANRKRAEAFLIENPLPKCRFCDGPVKSRGALVCVSMECHKKLKSQQNKRHRTEIKKRPRHVEPLPKCLYCDRPVIRRGAVTCGLRSCNQKHRALTQQAYRATRGYETSKNGFTLDEVRRYYGLKPLKKGRIRCHRCGKSFVSENTTAIRHCKDCRAYMSAVEVGSVKTCNFYEKRNRAVSGA